jgi:hypothetical protein
MTKPATDSISYSVPKPTSALEAAMPTPTAMAKA